MTTPTRESPDGALFVTGVFPPLNSAGSFRLIRLVRWMNRQGWRVAVLTMKPGADASLDPGLMTKVPPEVTVRATRAYYPLRALAKLKRLVSPKRKGPESSGSGPTESTPDARGGASSFLIDFLSSPDADIGWFPSATAAGVNLIRKMSPNVIISSGPPHTAHLAAAAIKKYSGAPFVADFRDPWSRAPWLVRSKRAAAIIRRAERFVVRNADRVVLNTAQMRDEFRSFYSDLPPERFHYVTNGFEEELLTFRKNAPVTRRGRFKITHAGNLYGERDPRPLLLAVSRLVRKGLLDRQALEIVQVGYTSDAIDLKGAVRELDLEDMVKILPPVAHKESLVMLSESDALLLVQIGTAIQTPSKLFEYMALGRPILALADEGSASDIIRKGKLGFPVTPGDEDALEAALLALVSGDYRFEPDEDFVQGFAGENLSESFEKIVLEAMGPSS